MAPNVLLRKLTYIRQLLVDLTPYRDATFSEVQAEHYKIERLFELLVVAATDILFHKLAEADKHAESYRDAFRLAAEVGLLPQNLAKQLQATASMRNLLVHMYEQIDYAILHESIKPALHDFEQFVVIMSSKIN